MLRVTTALLLCAALLATGCARTSAMRVAPVSFTPAAASQQPHGPDPALMARYVAQLPVGSRVRVALVNGKRLQGTLMSHEGERIVLLLRTRLPEPPVDVTLADIAALELEQTGSSAARVVAIGVATGVAATFGILLLLSAIFSD